MWEPPIGWRGDPERLRLGASDLARHSRSCPQEIGFKSRPSVYPQLGAWKKLYPQKRTFALGLVRDFLLAVHEDPTTVTFEGLQHRLKQECARRPLLHSAIKEFVLTAVESYIELHEEIEAEIGPLTLVLPEDEWRGYTVGPAHRQLTAWALMYQTADGCREIRRLRMSGDPGEEDAMVWAATAAKLATRNPGPRRIRVLDVAVGDSTMTPLFDGTAEEAAAYFRDHVDPMLPAVIAGEVAIPGLGCGNCKLVGACSQLPQVPGALGLESRGVATRSVSASDLDIYEKCPTRWLLERDQRLPRQVDSTPGQARGLAAHKWLRAAHRRGVPCSKLDLPMPGEASLGIADELMAPDEYAIVYPYLAQHISLCPLSNEHATNVVTEETVYCYDSSADLVVVTKPDIQFLRDNSMIFWETKTLDGDLPEDEGAVFDRWLSVAWGLTVLGHGFVQQNGAARGEVNLEVLTSEGGRVYTFETDDHLFAKLSRAEVTRRARDWHTDDEWKAIPGRQCEWCPVARWCPSREV
jgi:hypothetical protein